MSEIDFALLTLIGLTTLKIISWGILAIGVFQNVVYFLQLPAAWLEMRRYSQSEDTESYWELLISDMSLPISLLVPAHNEEATMVANVHALLGLEYPGYEVTIINDGSTDRTIERLVEAFSLQPINRAHELSVKHAPVKQLYGSVLHPRLIVIDKENGGKADAINAGINFSRYPLFCVIDADSLLEPKALLRAVRPFLEEPKRMIAVGGTLRIVNGCTIKGGQVLKVGLPHQFLPLIQTIEYIRAFLMARLAWSRWGVLTLISGAFGIFKRQAAIDVGGYSHGTVGEDLEIIVKMHKYFCQHKKDYLMRYVPEPVCWTEVPQSLSILSTQRERWQRGALEGFFKHRDMLANPKYGKIGLLGFPYLFISDVLGPIAELVGYLLVPSLYYLGILRVDFLLAFLALFFIFGVFISVSSLLLEETELRRFPRARDLLILTGIAIFENFGYRQLCSFWRIVGWWHFLRKRQGWGKMTREGFRHS